MRLTTGLIFLAVVLIFASSDARAQNYKIRQKTSIAGQSFESTIYVKGQRKRSETSGVMGMGGDVAEIEQCDLRQNVKVNDSKKLYLIEPFDDGEVSSPTPKTPPTRPSQPVTKGGTVTMSSSILDTGERKQVNGFTARRVKTSMTIESSPDACSPQNMKMEIDGWYIDLPAFACPVNLRRQVPAYERPMRSGCQDRYIFRSTGTAKTGFAISETMTMTQPGGETFTQTAETIEISRTTLDQALFEVPSNYTPVTDSSQLYGRPDIDALIRAAEKGVTGEKSRTETPATQSSSLPGPKKPGVIRIGVVVPTNRTEETVSVDALRNHLITRLSGPAVEAVALTDASDAKRLECDYIVSSDISKLKQSTASRIGGLFGKVTNTDTSGSRTYEAQADYVVTKVADGKTVAKSKASKKVDGSADKAAETVLEMAAAAILTSVK